jgi:hypothetical protein
MSLKPLLWKHYEKDIDKEEIWPKRVIGASLVYLEDQKKYFLIGGNFNAFENLNKLFTLNSGLINGVDKNIENFSKLNMDKLTYLTESIYNNQTAKNIEVYNYELKPGKIEISYKFNLIKIRF